MEYLQYSLLLLQPIIGIFIIQTILFDLNTTIKKEILNFILSFCVLFSSLCIYSYLLDEEKKKNSRWAILNAYMTIFCWILLEVANFDIISYRTTWATIYILNILLQTVIFFYK